MELTQFRNWFPKVNNFLCVHNKINLTRRAEHFPKLSLVLFYVFHLGKTPWKTFGKGSSSKNKNKT